MAMDQRACRRYCNHRPGGSDYAGEVQRSSLSMIFTGVRLAPYKMQLALIALAAPVDRLNELAGDR